MEPRPEPEPKIINVGSATLDKLEAKGVIVIVKTKIPRSEIQLPKKISSGANI